MAGLVYALILGLCLIEPPRSRSMGKGSKDGATPDDEDWPETAPPSSFGTKIAVIVRNPAAALLLCVFVGANFVAATFLAWLPSLVERAFGLGLTQSAFTSAVWPLASVPRGGTRGMAGPTPGCAASWRRPDTHPVPGADTRITIRSADRLVGQGPPAAHRPGWRRPVQGDLRREHLRVPSTDVVPIADRGTAAGLDEHRRLVGRTRRADRDRVRLRALRSGGGGGLDGGRVSAGGGAGFDRGASGRLQPPKIA